MLLQNRKSHVKPTRHTPVAVTKLVNHVLCHHNSIALIPFQVTRPSDSRQALYARCLENMCTCYILMYIYQTWDKQCIIYLTIIELTMWLAVCVCVWQSTPRTADVAKIAGYVRVRIFMYYR